MEQKTIYLVRHGKIKTDSQRCYIGQIDLPLTEEGRIQAQALAGKFSKLKLMQFTADLSCSRDTARNCFGSWVNLGKS